MVPQQGIVYVISFFFLQLQHLLIHLSPANLITFIFSTMTFHKLTLTKYNAFQIHWLVLLQTHQNLITLHQYSKNTLASNQTSHSTNCVFLHTKLSKFSNLHYLYKFLSFPSYSLSTKSSNSLVLSIPYVRTSLGKRAFFVIAPWLWNSLPPDTRNSLSLSTFRSKPIFSS